MPIYSLMFIHKFNKTKIGFMLNVLSKIILIIERRKNVKKVKNVKGKKRSIKALVSEDGRDGTNLLQVRDLVMNGMHM